MHKSTKLKNDGFADIITTIIIAAFVIPLIMISEHSAKNMPPVETKVNAIGITINEADHWWEPDTYYLIDSDKNVWTLDDSFKAKDLKTMYQNGKLNTNTPYQITLPNAWKIKDQDTINTVLNEFETAK